MSGDGRSWRSFMKSNQPRALSLRKALNMVTELRFGRPIAPNGFSLLLALNLLEEF
jgi:hypothetical protein